MTTELPPDTKLTYLKAQVAERTATFHDSVKWYRRRYQIATMATVVLSAIITVVAGLQTASGLDSPRNELILVLGALSTVVSAWGALFSPRESWLVYAATLNRLRALQTKLEFMTKEPDALTEASDAVHALFAEYQSIIDTHNRTWLDLRSTPSRSCPPGGHTV